MATVAVIFASLDFASAQVLGGEFIQPSCD